MSLIEDVRNEYWLCKTHSQGGLESFDGKEYEQCLDWMQSKMPLYNFIEIGSAWGASFHMWSTLIKGKKISVDALPNSVPFQYPNLTSEHIELRNIKWNSYFDNVHSVLGNSHDILTVNKVSEILSDELVDWLYIDAEHSYNSAKTEFELYSRFVSPTGYIGFHDIQLMKSDGDKNEPGCGVFWHELKNSGLYECIEFSGRDTKIGIIKLS